MDTTLYLLIILGLSMILSGGMIIYIHNMFKKDEEKQKEKENERRN